MTEPVMNASKNGSRPQKKLSSNPVGLLKRIEEYAEENPDAESYWIDNEYEAAQLLVAMAASLNHMRKTGAGQFKGETLQKYERIYRQAVNQGKALNYLRNVSEEDAISLFELRIRVPSIATPALQQ